MDNFKVGWWIKDSKVGKQIKIRIGKESIMKVLVMYYSKTGNTKKLAEEIVKGVKELEDVECVL